MRPIISGSRPLLALLTVLLGPFILFQSGCASKARVALATKESKPQPAGTSVKAPFVPDRPEKLTFPPLKYEPPRPQDFRIALKNGPISYVVPDHELPLVNIVIYVRTGEYVEPEGKEGVAAFLEKRSPEWVPAALRSK